MILFVGQSSWVKATVGSFTVRSLTRIYHPIVQILNFITICFELQHNLVQHLHVPAFLRALLLIFLNDFFGLRVILLNLFEFYQGQFYHVKILILLEVLFSLSLIERLCLDHILSIGVLVPVDLLNHSGVEFFRFPKHPTYHVVRVLNRKFKNRLVVIEPIRSRPLARFWILSLFLYDQLLLVNVFETGDPVLVSLDSSLTVRNF
jgi:hypothetical protein